MRFISNPTTSDFLATRRAIESLGELWSFRSEWKRWRPAIKQNWRWVSDEPASGLLFDLGSHMLHQCLALFGFPSTIYCQSLAQRDGSGVDDYFHITLTYSARPRFVCTLESGCLFFTGQRSFRVDGEHGTWEKRSGIDPQESMMIEGQHPRCPGWGVEKEQDWGLLHLVDGGPAKALHCTGDYVLYYEQIGAAVRGEAPVPIPGSEARQVIQLIEAAIESSRTGQRINLK